MINCRLECAKKYYNIDDQLLFTFRNDCLKVERKETASIYRSFVIMEFSPEKY